jgi:TonB family protein
MISTLAGIMLQGLAQAADPLVALPPPAPPPKGRARARADLGALISNDDYPAEALRNRVEGTVGFQLLVGADGRVTGCNIIQSSGSAILDSTTCRLISTRARFSPARNQQGRPVADKVVGRIVWRIAAGSELPPVAAAWRVITMRGTALGEVTCLAETSSEPPRAQTCPAGPAAQMAATGQKAGRTIENSTLIIITPAGEAEPAGAPDLGTLMLETETALSIAADGSVLECRLARNTAYGAANASGYSSPDPCGYAFAPGSKAFRPAAQGAAPRAVTVKFRFYARP